MKLFEQVSMYQSLLPFEDFRLHRDLPPDVKVGEYERAIVMKAAEEALALEIPQLYATEYMRFVLDGNRSDYEASYFARRRMLRALTLGEYLEGKGRYLNKIIDLIWLICEETTWVIPAHNRLFANGASALLTEQVADESRIIDLFAAETGAELAHTLYYLRNALDAAAPQVCARADYCLQRHILLPFEKYVYWWGGFLDGQINNWNPWIISNILLIVGIQVKEPLRRAALCDKALIILDRFVDAYHPDGGCDEGPSYWGRAASSLYDCLELIDDLTGGRVSFFDSELVVNMCDYFRKAFISGDYVMNFADAPATLSLELAARRLNYMGRRLQKPELCAFASYAGHRHGEKEASYAVGAYSIYCEMRNLFEQVPARTESGICQRADFPSLSVAVRREKPDFDRGLYFAIKGGTNGESHNHNDIGHFLLYKDGQPVFIDIGVGTYTRKTFSEERYTILPMTSPYHSVPQFGGHAQLPGSAYAGKNAVFTDGGLAVDIEGAYPPEAGVLHCRREGLLQGDTVTLCDTVEMAKPTAVTWNFICFDRPEICGNTVTAGHAVMTCPKELSLSFEDFVFDDPRFNRAWGRDRVYRLQGKAEVIRGEYTFILR